ncbi:MAG: hypothetical protein QM703_29255 [Gemmatales bacterium]
MAIKIRARSHFPCFEALEDRFLPSATSVLPLSHDAGLASVRVSDSLSNEVVKDGDHDDKAISTPATSAGSHIEQGKVTDAVFDSGNAGLSQMLAYKPMFAVITFQPGTMQFHETIYYSFVPYKPVVSNVKAKAPAANAFYADSDDVSSVAKNVVSTSVSSNLPVAVKPKLTTTDTLAKELVDVVVPVSTNRTVEQAAIVNLPLATGSVGSGLITLPTSSSSPVRTQEGQGSAQRFDPPSGESQETLPPNVRRGVVTEAGAGTVTSTESRLTEKLGLHTDESSLILNEIEQALQTLVEPFATNLQSFEPSVLWVFLSTWIAAAGITYEYLRRKVQTNQLSDDTWKEWRSLPQRIGT